ncbi:MAG: hypothetical protein M3506_04295 [Chloroflexota bacterium]|nr:hypothetical protein [Chloroflexota bacterium]
MNLLSALLVLLALSGGGGGGPSPTLVLDPSGSARDETISFLGAAYTPGAEVAVVLGEDAALLTITTANPDGVISGVFATPDPGLIPEMAGKSAPVYATEIESGARSTPTRLRVAKPIRAAGPQRRETAGLSLELEIGKTPRNATYWVLFGVPEAPAAARRLTDPEGDGIYSLSVEVEAGTPLAIRLVQGTGTRNTAAGPSPDKPMQTFRQYPTFTPQVAVLLRLGPPAGR